MNKNNTSVIGLILIILGGLLLLGNTGIINVGLENLWPFIILVIGLVFELQFFSGGRKEPGLLVPAGILLTIGVIFLICVTLGWNWMEVLWPFFILAPAVGLIQLYLLGERQPGLLVPVGILSAVGLFFLSIQLGFHAIWRIFIPLIMVLIGISLLFKRGK